MDKTNRISDTETVEEKSEKRVKFKGLGAIFTEVKEMARRERIPIYDLILFTVGLLFARCHLLFGAYPIGVAFLSSLSGGVFSALLGTVIGSLALGRSGLIFAVVSAITVFIRVIISGGDGREGGLFSENLLLRMCAAVIGGFVSAVYELLLYGFSESSVLFSVSMILIPPMLSFLFSGVLSSGFSLSRIMTGRENMLSLAGKSEQERYNLIFFKCSAVALLFFVALSLADANIIGISFSYIFLGFATLLVAKRFGALSALAVGFICSLGVSGVFSVSFGLLGLAAGGLFYFGMPYGIVGGGAAALAWAAYSSGLGGLLSVLPEYSISAIVAMPILKRLSPELTVKENEKEESSARDMIGTMALVYQKKYSQNLDALETSLVAVSELCSVAESSDNSLKDAYRAALFGVAEDYCRSCPGYEYCLSEDVNPAVKNADLLVSKMLSGERILPEDVNLENEFCQYSKEMAIALSRAAAMAKRELLRKKESPDSECYSLIARLIREARAEDESERSVNSFRSEQLEKILESEGLGTGASKVFGDRLLHLFIAEEDKDGDRITSPELKRAIEEGMGIRLGSPEFFRRESMALMECSILPSYTVRYAKAKHAAIISEGSGDTLSFFETDGGMIYSLISDGMGRGRAAEETSRFVSEMLTELLRFSSSADAVIHLINRALRERGSESSATVDLFGLDSYSGEAVFLKSGAAVSYIKRGESIFRIRSKTAPLGLLSTVDTERVKVEVKEGDVIIMLSDGICQGQEESAWLLELLTKPMPKEIGVYAEMILKEAEKRDDGCDDMSVAIMKIEKAV